MKLTKIIITALLVGAALVIPVSAKTPYQTYTYSNSGKALFSPAAYIPADRVSGFGEAGTLNRPRDITADKEGNIYIADTGNDRVVVLDSELNLKSVLKEFESETGEADSLKGPQGVYIAEDGRIYIADTENSRVAVFNSDLTFSSITGEVDLDLLPDNFTYKPKAVAANRNGRLYVVSQNTNMGVMVLGQDGAFEGFIGAQRVSVNALELFWRSFMSQEQLARRVQFVPVEYSGITMDSDGFLFVTSSSINRFDLYKSLRSTDSVFAPIKKINPSGTDLLRRNGFFAPVGDISFSPYSKKGSTEPSSIEKAVLLDNGVYMLVDRRYSKIFAYDQSGNLLYAFGGQGESVGLYNQLISAAAFGDKLYTLDEISGGVTVLNKTDYALQIDNILKLQNDGDYKGAIEGWDALLRRNNNLDLAYFNIGKAQLDNGSYKAAMESFRLIGNKGYYNKAFRYQRQSFLDSYGIWLLLSAIALVIILIRLAGRVKRFNRGLEYSATRGKLGHEISFGWFTIFHPFKGFYSLKHEKRGSIRSATLILILALGSFLASRLMAPYLSTGAASPSPVSAALNFLLPFVLFLAANWCVTSLTDGKGSLKDIYIALCYALIPLIIFLIPLTVIGHGLVVDELALLSIFSTLAYGWMGLLVFFSMMTIHDFTLGKNVITIALAIVVIGLILFLGMTFFSLLGQIGTTIINLVKELSLRN